MLLRVLDGLVELSVPDNFPKPLHHPQADGQLPIRPYPTLPSHSQMEVQLRALLYSVRLWQAWSAELPLAALRKPVVQLIYDDVPPGERVLPGYQAQLCNLHSLWEAAPQTIRVPLFCGEAEAGDPYQTWRYLYTPPWQLADNSIFTEPTPSDPEPSSDLSAVVGLATVLEFAAATYGPESIATLIANTPYHSSWETLIPAVFSVPLADFEAGWQAYMRESYGISKW
jgi:hypothetical protein